MADPCALLTKIKAQLDERVADLEDQIAGPLAASYTAWRE
jgi:hypothetical protein